MDYYPRPSVSVSHTKMSVKGPRSRAWVFTLNNYTENDEKYLQETLDCDYIVYGREVSPSGTPHLQGFVYFKNPRNGTTVGKYRKWWCAPAKADSLSNGAYTKKGDDWFEKGARPATSEEKGAGERDRYKRAYECAIAGDLASVDSDILIRNYSTLKRLKAELTKAETLDYLPLCLFFYGETGTGKSRLAEELIGAKAYRKDPSSRWWTGYQHEEYVLINEIEHTDSQAQSMYKQLCDYYPLPVETKGGNLIIRPKVIIFTSNWHPKEVFGPAWAPMARRLTLHNFTVIGKDATRLQAIESFRAFQASRCPVQGTPSSPQDGVLGQEGVTSPS